MSSREWDTLHQPKILRKALARARLRSTWFWAAVKLWNLDPQGWLLVVVIAIIYLIFDLVAILGRSNLQAMLPSIIVNGLALILGILPGTREAFGQS